MQSLEREKNYESFGNSLSRIAYAYGFSNTPVVIPKKSLSTSTAISQKTQASLALVKGHIPSSGPLQSWGSSHAGKAGTLLSFAIFASKQAVAHAIVVKTVLSIAEVAHVNDLSVLVSSVGDAESRRRFTRELTNFFKKNSENVMPDVKHIAVHDPDRAYLAMMEKQDPVIDKAPRPIDFLSENSRKTMLETLSFFESIGIPYSLESRLPAATGIQSELLFAVEGMNKRGEKTRIAEGGRFDEAIKQGKSQGEVAVSMSMSVEKSVDPEVPRDEPACFVVHVGDIAKLKAFSAIESLWRSNFLVGEALMGASLRDQMQRAQTVNSRYVVIIGQREALDGTVMVRNLATQMQVTIPMDKLPGYIGRTHSR